MVKNLMNLTSFLQKPHRKIYFVGFLIILLSCLNLAFLDNEELINSYAIKQFFLVFYYQS